mgnify:FL=1
MPPRELPDADALIASLLNLMTRFASLGCPQHAALIRRELALLVGYPDEQVAPLVKQVCRRLEGEWAQLRFAIDDDSPHSQPSSTLH